LTIFHVLTTNPKGNFMSRKLFFLFLFFSISFPALFGQKGIEFLSPTPTGSIMTDIAVVDKNTAWASGTLGTVLKTTDAGKTWQLVKSGEDIWYTSLHAIDAQKVFLTSWNQNLQSTTDGGKTWKSQQIGKLFYLKKVSFVDSKNGFLLGSKEVGENETEPVVQLWVTTDGGETWNERNSTLKIDPVDFRFFTDKIGFAIVGKYDGSNNHDIYRTTDGGVNWQPVKSPSNVNISSISIVNAKIGFAVADSPAATGNQTTSKLLILKTVDAGATWTSIDTQLPPTSKEGQEPHYIWFMNEKTGWVIKSNPYTETSRSNLLRTDDGGKTWKITWSSDETGIGRIGFFDGNTGVVLPGLWFLTPKIFRTTDGGNSFAQLAEGLELNFTSMAFPDVKNGFASNKQGVIKTIDGGYTWKQSFEATFSYVDQITFFNKNEGLAILRDDDGKCTIYRTANGGDSWASEPLVIKGYTQKIIAVDPNTMFASIIELDNKYVIKSVDGGKTWKDLVAVTVKENDFYDLQFIDSKNGWLLGTMVLPGAPPDAFPTAFIKSTTDGGESWQDNIFYGQTMPSNLTFIDPLHGWYVSNTNDTSRIMSRTLDGGKTWEQLPFLPPYELIEYLGFSDPLNGWMVRVYGAPLSPGFVYRTKDGGKTWDLAYTLNYLNKMVFPDKKTIYAGGWMSLVKITLDD
jgi:photosystem II stability/assembly factor-like uncharacterized protein